MASVNVDRMTVKELVDLEAKLQTAIPLARQRERANVKQEMTALAEKHGLTLREVFGGRGKGKLVAPKYANPDDPSQTWAGRGRKPLWLVAKMKKKGAKLKQFAI